MITKQDALAKLDAADEAAYNTLLARVDAALPKYDGKSIQIDVENVAAKVIRRVIEKGQASGWAVKEEWGDQRDPGHWLTFS